MTGPCADGCQRGHGAACYAARRGHRRYCELIAEGREDYAALVDARSATEPSLWQKATNFAGAIVSHLAAGLPRVDDPELERRLAICRGCERYQPDPPRCLACGCKLNVKAAWGEQKCPLGKWEAAAREEQHFNVPAG